MGPKPEGVWIGLTKMNRGLAGYAFLTDLRGAGLLEAGVARLPAAAGLAAVVAGSRAGARVGAGGWGCGGWSFGPRGGGPSRGRGGCGGPTRGRGGGGCRRGWRRIRRRCRGGGWPGG